MQAILKIYKGTIGFALAVIVGVVLSSCGSASNNDQGTSVTLLGFFAEFGDRDNCVDLPEGELGIQLPLAIGAETTETPGASGGVTTIAGVQNNLNGQFFRSQKALIEYYIEGATAQPPTTTASVNMVVFPSVNSGGDGGDSATTNPFDSSLPPSFNPDGGCSIGFGEFYVLPPAIVEWLNFNQTALPEPPFFMTAKVRVSGLTSAGDRLETNEALYDFIFTPATVVPPCNGTDGGCAGQGSDSDGSAGDTQETLVSPNGLVLE